MKETIINLFFEKFLTIIEFSIHNLLIYTWPNNIKINLISDCTIYEIIYYKKKLTGVSVKIEENNEKIPNKTLVLKEIIKGTDEIEKFAFKYFVKN